MARSRPRIEGNGVPEERPDNVKPSARESKLPGLFSWYTGCMTVLGTPSIPQFNNPVAGALGNAVPSLPIVLDVSPLALLVLTMLVGIFIAAVSVVLIYHWRRFPFEHDTFRTAERIYLAGTLLLLAVAVVGILMS